MKTLLLAAALGWSESPALLHLAAAPLLEQQTLDTDLERLHGLADDLGFRMQGSQADLRDAVRATSAGLSRPSVWRAPKLQRPVFVVYRPVFSEEWGGAVAPGDASLSPFFRHNGQLYLAIRRDQPAPSRWRELWHRLRWGVPPQRTVLYRIRADGRAVVVLELPAPPGGGRLTVVQTSPDRFVLATPGARLHRLVVDFKPE